MDGEETGILAVADADRGHRDSRGHLHDRVQSIDAVERAAGAGQTDNGKDGVPCEHAREGCGTAVILSTVSWSDLLPATIPTFAFSFKSIFYLLYKVITGP